MRTYYRRRIDLNLIDIDEIIFSYLIYCLLCMKFLAVLLPLLRRRFWASTAMAVTMTAMAMAMTAMAMTMTTMTVTVTSVCVTMVLSRFVAHIHVNGFT